MKKDWILTQESFDALLDWLDPSREEAGRKYEEIRVRLIKIFTCRGCYESEELADETINRVSDKLHKIEATYQGARAPYFYGVANKVYLEYQRRPPTPIPPPPADDCALIEQEHACLEKCIEKLTFENRRVVRQYYKGEKTEKIDQRKKLAKRLGIALNALRIRAHRLRTKLQDCVEFCLEEPAT
ncbi:MAG TPA: hypothetical protein VNO50_16940 [Pyrinomonadaceae bacterium]|nr:hypothetical protein [Pyrinomonadaceae bacterium]